MDKEEFDRFFRDLNGGEESSDEPSSNVEQTADELEAAVQSEATDNFVKYSILYVSKFYDCALNMGFHHEHAFKFAEIAFKQLISPQIIMEAIDDEE
jgi:hypothetical protein